MPGRAARGGVSGRMAHGVADGLCGMANLHGPQATEKHVLGWQRYRFPSEWRAHEHPMGRMKKGGYLHATASRWVHVPWAKPVH